GVKHPRLESEVQRRQRGKPLAKAAVDIEAFARSRGEHPKTRVAVPGRAVADAAETAARGDDMLLEDAPGAPAGGAQVDIADNPGAMLGRAVFAALAHRRDAGDKGRLAERARLRRPLGAVHLAAFEKDRGADVVAARRVLYEVVQQIAVAGPVPQMMVRIDDRAVRLARRLLGRGEPVLADRQMALPGIGRLHRRGSSRGRRFCQVCDGGGTNAILFRRIESKAVLPYFMSRIEVQP